MGWNSYDYYDTTVTEDAIRKNARFMAEHLKEYGWEYVVVDIQWYSTQAGQQRDRFQYVPFAKLQMDEYSRLLPDPERFPSSTDGRGFGPLAEYVHSLGLKFGIHMMRGIPRQAAYLRTKIKGTYATANEVADPYSICAWNPDMYGVDPDAEGAQAYYDSMLELYASWGVDFIKCDDICRMDAASSKKEIMMLSKAIKNCGRDIVLSLSPGPAILKEQAFYHEHAHMWRITDDFWDSWDSLMDMFERCRQWQDYVKTGGYPDCDMLPLGKIGKGFGQERDTNFTYEEQKTMLTLWSIFRSPLMLGAELTKLDEDTLGLLTNRELYRMNATITSSKEIRRSDKFIFWEAKAGDTIYSAIFNISDDTGKIPADWPGEGFESAFDVWSGRMTGKNELPDIPPHGALLLRR